MMGKDVQSFWRDNHEGSWWCQGRFPSHRRACPLEERSVHTHLLQKKCPILLKLCQRNVNSTLSELTFPIKLNWFLSDFSHKQMLDEKVWGLCNFHLVQRPIKQTYSGLLKWNHWKFRLQDRVKVVQSSQWECKCLQRSSSLFPQPEQTHYWAICKW